MEKILIDSKSINLPLIRKVANMIRRGKIAALPTETVYGLAGYIDKKGVADKLYAIKKRPKDKPFAYAFADADIAKNSYFSIMPPFGYRLIEKFWPGPLTIIYYSLQDEKIGVRVPSHIVTQQILKELNGPVYFPSANASGQKEAVTAGEVEAGLSDQIDLIIDGGSCLYSKPSTVIDLTYHPFKILRKGVVSEKSIVDVFIKKRALFVCTGNTCRSPMAQFLFEKYLGEAKPYLKERYEIISRGIYASDGVEAAPYIKEILKDNDDLDLRGFSSKKLDRDIVLSSDLIFVMEEAHKDYILDLEPKVANKIFPLNKFLPLELQRDIPDPLGKSFETYKEVYELIKKAVLELRDWL